MANLFVHFEPNGHSLRHNAKTDAGSDVHEKYRDALQRGVGGHENEQPGLPSYIVPGTPEETHWRAAHPQGMVCKLREVIPFLVAFAKSDHLCRFSLEIQSKVVDYRIHCGTSCSPGW
jgi:hypothetical protein